VRFIAICAALVAMPAAADAREIMVHLRLVEINLTKLRELGADFSVVVGSSHVDNLAGTRKNERETAHLFTANSGQSA
jgi:Flp pilus assembly secretin CpaC